MLAFLKRIFQYEPRPVKVQEIEARLTATDGSRLNGELEFEVYDDGNWELEIDIEHMGTRPDGPLDIRINGRSILTLPVSERGNDTEKKLKSRFGDTLAITPTPGMDVEIRNAMGILLHGTFGIDRRAARVR